MLDDAGFFGTLCLPLAGAAACLQPAVLAPLLVTLPRFLALRAAAALRRSPGGNVGPAGVVLMEGLRVAGALALLHLAGAGFSRRGPLGGKRDGAAREPAA